ncbi:MAG: BPSS1780 family membrane protein [Gammaproteobacteria bacterium]
MSASRAEVKQVAEWYWAGWALFKKNPAIWVLFTLIWLVLAFALLLSIPLIGPIGPIAWWVMTPVLYGGYLLAARELEHGRTPVVRHLFQGLLEKDQRRRLLTIGVVTLAALFILFLVLGAGSQLGGGAIDPDHVRSLSEWLNLFLRALLVAMVSGVSGMGLIYSSPLVLFTPMEGIEAVMTSFEACWNNWRVVLAFFGVFTVLALGAVLTLGLGFLVVMPVAYCASYQSYKSLFAEPEGV